MLYIAAVSLHYVHYSRKSEGVTDLVLAKTGCAWCAVEVWCVCVCVCVCVLVEMSAQVVGSAWISAQEGLF